MLKCAVSNYTTSKGQLILIVFNGPKLAKRLIRTNNAIIDKLFHVLIHQSTKYCNFRYYIITLHFRFLVPDLLKWQNNFYRSSKKDC